MLLRVCMPFAQIVDEKLWNSDDEDDKGKEEGKDKKEEQYDDRGAISVDDKKDLDYEVCVASHTHKHTHTHTLCVALVQMVMTPPCWHFLR